jgi:hypothetical protein
LLVQLVGLERRTARGGRDSIDHAPGAHDDLANAVAGLTAVAKRGAYDSSLSWVSGPDDDSQRQRLMQHILQTGGYYRQRRWLRETTISRRAAAKRPAVGSRNQA